MVKKQRNSVRGFTFIEIIVAVSIFLMLMLGIYGVMDVGRGSWFRASTAVELRQEIMRALTRMGKELKEVRPALISLAVGDISSSLTLRVPQRDINGNILDALGNIVWSGDITYALNGSNEITRTASGLTSIIARDIVTLEFTRPAGEDRILQISITARKTSVLGNIAQDIGQMTVEMRN